jgi:hypothetical protein
LKIAGLDNLCRANNQLAVMLAHNKLLKPLLNFPAKMLAIQHVNAAIHEAEAVSGTHYRIARKLKDRAALNLHEIEIAAEALPGVSEFRFHC